MTNVIYMPVWLCPFLCDLLLLLFSVWKLLGSSIYPLCPEASQWCAQQRIMSHSFCSELGAQVCAVLVENTHLNYYISADEILQQIKGNWKTNKRVGWTHEVLLPFISSCPTFWSMIWQISLISSSTLPLFLAIKFLLLKMLFSAPFFSLSQHTPVFALWMKYLPGSLWHSDLGISSD